MTQPSVLVTGAGGFVGRALTRGFCDLGWRVLGLDRSFDDGWGSGATQKVLADLNEGVPPGLPRVEVVVHGAWVTTDPDPGGDLSADYHASNVRPLEAVLDYVGRTGPAAFIFLSSSGVFSPGDAKNSPVGPRGKSSASGLTDGLLPTGTSRYAVAKRAGEALVSSLLTEKTRTQVVRLGHLFGPGELARPSRAGVSLVARWLASARVGRPLEVRSDDPLRDWTFTPDLAAALERVALEPSMGRPLHVGSPHTLSDRAWADLVAARFPGVEVLTLPALGTVKPPMIPSDVPSLRGLEWCAPAEGLSAMMTEGSVP